jgi:hypothetical protein
MRGGRRSGGGGGGGNIRGLGVAAQVKFERQTLKPGFHLIRAWVETRRLSAMGQGESVACTAPPWQALMRRWWGVAASPRTTPPELPPKHPSQPPPPKCWYPPSQPPLPPPPSPASHHPFSRRRYRRRYRRRRARPSRDARTCRPCRRRRRRPCPPWYGYDRSVGRHILGRTPRCCRCPSRCIAHPRSRARPLCSAAGCI